MKDTVIKQRTQVLEIFIIKTQESAWILYC